MALPFLDRFVAFVTEEPLARGVQALLILGASFLVFLVFLTTRDILGRTRSLLAQVACILLVAALPVVGFLLYLLIRPGRTLKERGMEMALHESLKMLKELHEKMPDSPIPKRPQAPILKSTLIAQRSPPLVSQP